MYFLVLCHIVSIFSHLLSIFILLKFLTMLLLISFFHRNCIQVSSLGILDCKCYSSNEYWGGNEAQTLVCVSPVEFKEKGMGWAEGEFQLPQIQSLLTILGKFFGCFGRRQSPHCNPLYPDFRGWRRQWVLSQSPGSDQQPINRTLIFSFLVVRNKMLVNLGICFLLLVILTKAVVR